MVALRDPTKIESLRQVEAGIRQKKKIHSCCYILVIELRSAKANIRTEKVILINLFVKGLNVIVSLKSENKTVKVFIPKQVTSQTAPKIR